ncbi:MAG: ABC transporter ATP-binding protein [Oscillospiraceae bacterium]|jgi:putative ABC transport system ATP-binding protein|nr:ABC transporter ATP-binding protein [Oscillospiraceae bacterium]
MGLIELSQGFKIYNEGYENEVRALNGVSLSIDRGEFVSIIGTSGSGKSTMMNILGCLDVLTHGEYVLDGENVTDMRDGRLSRIRNREVGFVFQGFNLIESLTAYENVELPLVYQGVSARLRREMAESALERVGIMERADHHPSELSGGQQQRVAIARAISTNPPIIMADEPTGALDSKTGDRVLELMHGLHGTGSTIILITHNNELAETASRIVRISDGQIVEDRRRVPA